MSLFALFILITHYCLVAILCLYGAHRIYHSFVAKRVFETVNHDVEPPSWEGDYPHITVQTPMYNEKFVANALLMP